MPEEEAAPVLDILRDPATRDKSPWRRIHFPWTGDGRGPLFSVSWVGSPWRSVHGALFGSGGASIWGEFGEGQMDRWFAASLGVGVGGWMGLLVWKWMGHCL